MVLLFVVKECCVSGATIYLNAGSYTLIADKSVGETVGNEGQQPPLPGQEAPGQQEYYGWQYDQNDSEVAEQSPSMPPPQTISPRPSQPLPQPSQPLPPPQQYSPAYPPPSTQAPYQPQVPERYQQPIQDMGTTLGYG